ncbi:hypothetical protein [Streptomyces sp. NPDC057250]|uniref:hypothetical protein n=1 Tax=Streptomyces sp. NPDC057250 TaxID=3346068 RepID=UPI0036457002
MDWVNRPHAACDHEDTKVARAACRRAMKRSGQELPPVPKRLGKKSRSRRRGYSPRQKPPMPALSWEILQHMRENPGEQPFTWLWVRLAFREENGDDVTDAIAALLSHNHIEEVFHVPGADY